MKSALIFPGQGAQRPGMGREFYDRYRSAKAVFNEVDDALGFSLSEIIFNGTPEELAHTTITQPAILTVSIAAFRALEEELGTELTPACVAGHSLGEYTSLVASGVLSLTDGVRLVHLRGGLMQDAVPIGVGGMAAVIGLTLDEVIDAAVSNITMTEARFKAENARNIGAIGVIVRSTSTSVEDGITIGKATVNVIMNSGKHHLLPSWLPSGDLVIRFAGEPAPAEEPQGEPQGDAQ